MSADVQRRLMAEYRISKENIARLERYVDLLIGENASQNLIAKSTEASVWDRHILDSVQLQPLLRGATADIGSGAGLPGVVLAIISGPIALVEPRRKRSEFLTTVIDKLSLDAVVHPFHVEQLTCVKFDTITARAFAPLTNLFQSTIHLAHAATRWVLPKGRNGVTELEVARRSWHGSFTTIPSITDPDAVIIVAEDVRPKV